jgi:predicted O-methyltransferase YrrM
VGVVAVAVAVGAFANGQPYVGALVLLTLVVIAMQVWNRMLLRVVSRGLDRSVARSTDARAAESRRAAEFAWLAQRIHFMTEAAEASAKSLDQMVAVPQELAALRAELATVSSATRKLRGLPDDVDRIGSAVQQIRRGGTGLPLRQNLQSDLSATLALHDDRRADRPPLSAWTLAPQVLLEVLRRVSDPSVETVVELGSGVSTVWIASELRRRGHGRLISIEHEEQFFDQTRALVEAAGLADLVDLRLCPLAPVEVDGESYEWYSIGAGDLPSVDLLLVDGPPAKTGPLARFPALPVLGAALSGHAVVVLDDAARPDEREIVARWTSDGCEPKLLLVDTLERAVVLARPSAER